MDNLYQIVGVLLSVGLIAGSALLIREVIKNWSKSGPVQRFVSGDELSLDASLFLGPAVLTALILGGIPSGPASALIFWCVAAVATSATCRYLLPSKMSTPSRLWSVAWIPVLSGLVMGMSVS